MDKSAIGKRIKELRSSKGLTQKDFAISIGVSAAALSQFENSQNLPSVEILNAISKHYLISLDWLIGGVTKDMSYLMSGSLSYLDKSQFKSTQNLVAEPDIPLDNHKYNIAPLYAFDSVAMIGNDSANYYGDIKIPIQAFRIDTGLCACIVPDERMQPTFIKDDVVIFDSYWGFKPKKGLVYLTILHDGKMHLSRIESNNPDKQSWTFVTDNPDKRLFPNVNFSESEVESCHQVLLHISKHFPVPDQSIMERISRLETAVFESKTPVK